MDRNLGVEIEKKKAFIERESARLLSLGNRAVATPTKSSTNRSKELEEALQVGGN